MYFILLSLLSSCHGLLDAGDNGTIDGQGSIWWNWFHNKTLNYTRPHLVELINSTGVFISNLTFTNSPFWTIHPVYCRFLLCRMIELISSLFVLLHSASYLNRTKMNLLRIKGRGETFFSFFSALTAKLQSKMLQS